MVRLGAACSAKAPLQGCHVAAYFQALCAASFAECKRFRVALSMHSMLRRCWVANSHAVQHMQTKRWRTKR